MFKRPDGSMKLDSRPSLQELATTSPILKRKVHPKTASKVMIKTVINFDTKNFFEGDRKLKIAKVQIEGDQRGDVYPLHHG